MSHSLSRVITNKVHSTYIRFVMVQFKATITKGIRLVRLPFFRPNGEVSQVTEYPEESNCSIGIKTVRIYASSVNNLI